MLNQIRPLRKGEAVKPSTAPAQTDPTERLAKIEQIARCAVVAVYDRYCSGSIADLEDAVVALTGRPVPDEEDETDDD